MSRKAKPKTDWTAATLADVQDLVDELDSVPEDEHDDTEDEDTRPSYLYQIVMAGLPDGLLIRDGKHRQRRRGHQYACL